jgi:hypothetical protein
MKTSLKLIALLLAAGFPCVALADFAGLNVPSSVSPESFLGLFVAAGLGLVLLGDYSRRGREIVLTGAPVIVPPANAFVTPRTAKSGCLAA